MSKRRQRFFAISHSANKRPKYTHNSGLQLLSSSEEDTEPSSSTTHSDLRKLPCPQCVVLNNEVKWLRSRIEKYEEQLQARIDKLDRLLLLASNGRGVDNLGFDVLPFNPLMGFSVPGDVADFGGTAVSSMENPTMSLATESSVLSNFSSDNNNVLSSTNIPDISVDDDNDNNNV
jgi:hypothetical protein